MTMQRYIDKDELIKRMQRKKSLDWFIELCDMEEADVVEVVRCRDCKFRHTATCFAKHETADDDYCSNCARMDGDER